MNINALSVANYFLELAHKENRPIHLLGLVKRVYIAHGFSLAMLDKPLIDPRFDRVEAWKYGPVIPSVYHSFKQYKASPITEPTVIMECDENFTPTFITPTLIDEKAKMIVEMVWNRYRNYTDSQLVSLTHREGTPWGACYVPGENREIPELPHYKYELLYSRIQTLWQCLLPRTPIHSSQPQISGIPIPPYSPVFLTAY